MFRVLVMGGAGVFGSRLVDAMLTGTDWQIVVAGRDAARGRAFAAARGERVSAMVLDARQCSAADLAATGAQAVVDAAGPFQDADYHLALAAAAARLHYIDIADARGFMAGFASAVGPAALQAGTVALTGASSTPAWSNAALDAVTAGWQRIDDIVVVITPGNRAPRGLSVVRAILSYAGGPVRVFTDGAWTTAPGWGLTRRADVPGLGRRWASLCETPDLDILPHRYRVTHSALFLAGLELPVLHLGLVVMSLAVRFGLMRTLAPLAAITRAIAGLLLPFGTDRGGMMVEAIGVDGAGHRTRARWTLVAEGGEGPSVPILPALAALRAIAATPPPAGARICVGVLPLAALEAELVGRRIAVARTRQELGPNVFPAALGTIFQELPAAVAALHQPSPTAVWQGRADVEGGSTRLARLLARVFGFPAAARDIDVTVTIAAGPDEESWTRNFGGRSFHSVLRCGPQPGAIEERFGPFHFRLGLIPDASGISMAVLGWRVGKLPLPRRLAIRSDARESVDAAGRFHFDVPIDLPLGLGRLVRYSGWLVPAGQ